MPGKGFFVGDVAGFELAVKIDSKSTIVDRRN
jgi:hypothetical protein